MRPRTLLILLLVVIGLVAFIALYERELPSSDERAAQTKLIFRFDDEDVDGLEIEWEGETVVLERRTAAAEAEEREDAPSGEVADEWRLLDPLEARADESLVASLVAALTSLEKERTLEDMTAAEVGLDEPRARVTVRVEDDVQELLIGSEVPASSTMIVGLEDTDDFFVVADGIWSQLIRAPGEWRSREVFAADREDIERISLSVADRRLTLARRGEDFWLEEPLADRADEEKVTKLLADVTSLTVASFVDEPERMPNEMGLDPARAVLEVVLEERAEPFRLELGEPVADTDGRLTARVDDQIIELETELALVMEESLTAWQSTAWSHLETFEIDSIVVVDEAGTMTLERAGASWTRADDEIPFTTASDLLYAITETEAERILSPAEAESLGAVWESPELVLRLGGDDEGGREELTLYTGAAGEYLARTGDRESVLLLPAAAVEEIRDKIAAARSAESVPAEED
ncbi:MAG: DUF4340 domain-containing protein [Acidobacteria bacterium]|nr:MAG: DUF4340 domain-containing protein [Acidobacteriota bacterium]